MRPCPPDSLATCSVPPALTPPLLLPPCLPHLCSKCVENWGPQVTQKFFEAAGFSAQFLGALVDPRNGYPTVAALLGKDSAALESFTRGWCSAEHRDAERLTQVITAQRQAILERPGEHSLWLQDVVRGPQFGLWAVLWAFAPYTTLAVLRLSSSLPAGMLPFSPLLDAFFPYWAPSSTALAEFTDTQPVWAWTFFAACQLANAINLVFLLQAARDKALRIPFLLVLELFTMLLVWVAWWLLSMALPPAALVACYRLAILAVPVIRYSELIPFQDGSYSGIRAFSTILVAKEPKDLE